MNLTDEFLNNILSIEFEDITPQALEKLRMCLIDTLGVTIAGAFDLKDKEKALLNLMDDAETLCPIGIARPTSLTNAIFLNGLSSHYLELDDGVRYGVIHPSAPMFSALIPLAIFYHVDWNRFVLASIRGYETSIRLATALQPYHYSAGFHPTATCCTLGVAVAVATLLNFTYEQTKDAFSAASLSSSGTLKVLEDVSQLKPFNCARAAMMGYLSALMARAGFKGPNDALDGETGFLKMMASHFNKDELLRENEYFYVEKIYLKPYASCRHTHPEIEAAIKIRGIETFDYNHIKSIRVDTYKGVIGKHDGHDIYGESSARMSIPYSLAVSLVTGKAGIAEFSAPYTSCQIILDITKKVSIFGDEEISKLVPDKRAAVVTLTMDNGEQFTVRVDYPKGEPENPLSRDELLAKFLSVTSHAIFDEVRARKLFETVMDSDFVNINQLNI